MNEKLPVTQQTSVPIDSGYRQLVAQLEKIDEQIVRATEKLKQLKSERKEIERTLLHSATREQILDYPVQWASLPPRIQRAFDQLASDGRQLFLTYRDVVSVSTGELYMQENIAWSSIDRLERHLKELGLALRP